MANHNWDNQIEGHLRDEEHARLLQEEEVNLAGGAAAAAAQQNIRQRLNIPRPSDVVVRVNLLSGMQPNANSLKIRACVSTCWSIPQIIAIVCVLTLYWPNPYCDMPLHVWVIVSGVRLSVSLILNIVIFVQSVYTPENRPSLLLFISQGLDNLHFIWFLLGNYWFFASKNCNEVSHMLYQLTMALLILDYIDFFKRVVLLVCLLPLAICCLPCVLRFLATVQQQAGGQDGGARTQAIARLPVTEYKAGLFSDAEPACAICMDTYHAGDMLRVFKCDKKNPHHFHQRCIDDWLKVNFTCPNCRRRILGDAVPVDEEDQGVLHV